MARKPTPPRTIDEVMKSIHALRGSVPEREYGAEKKIASISTRIPYIPGQGDDEFADTSPAIVIKGLKKWIKDLDSAIVSMEMAKVQAGALVDVVEELPGSALISLVDDAARSPGDSAEVHEMRAYKMELQTDEEYLKELLRTERAYKTHAKKQQEWRSKRDARIAQIKAQITSLQSKLSTLTPK